jgi:predicted Zn-dependent peptidase
VLRATLDNGLEVYLVEDRTAPLVSYQVWFSVGSVDEREMRPGDTHGLTGLSHFFEHLMFRGTAKYPKFFDQIYEWGGQLNAFTWLDETVYWETLPSAHLEAAIAMEADRLEHLRVDFLNVEPEREVVKSERLLRTENSAYGRATEILEARAFTSFSYHWGTIGWRRDLDAISIEEAQAYHTEHYAPNSAAVVVVGDHDPPKTLAWLKQAYGHLPTKHLPARDYPAEPAQTAERRDRLLMTSDSPLTLWAYHAPAVRERDFLVLEVIDRLLTAGKSSRLQKLLVYSDPPRLGSLRTALYPSRFPYLYGFILSPIPGTTNEEIERSIDTELAALAREGARPDELARAVASLQGDLVRQRLSFKDKAEMIGWSLMTTDDPATLMRRLEEYPSVTSDEVRRVAGAVLRSENRTLTPVVDPGRLNELMEAVFAITGPSGQDFRGLVDRAVRILHDRRDLARKHFEIGLETRAIQLLQERAARAKEGAAPALAAEIDSYLTDSEKGVTKRTERLAAERKALAESEASLASSMEALKEGLQKLPLGKSKLPPRGGGGAEPPGVPDPWLSALAHAVAAGRLPEGILAWEAPTAADRARRLGCWVLAAWVAEDGGLHAGGEAFRQRVLDEGSPPEGISPEHATLWQTARALAWDTRVVGRRAEDAWIDVGGPP